MLRPQPAPRAQLRALAVTICLAAGGGTAACGVAGTDAALRAASAPPAAHVEPAHPFALETHDGQLLALADLRGKWVIVNFWATWCAPCVDEMPYLQQLADVHAGEVVVLGINQREDATRVAEFARQHQIAFPLLIDPDDATLLAYDVRGLPLTAVIAPDGTVAHTFRGPLLPAEFERWLAQQLE